MTTTTSTKKANATLAKELKQLGFTRGYSSWEKSDFKRHIHADSKSGEQIIINVHIYNTYNEGWVVDRVHLETKRLTEDFKSVGSSVELGSNALLDLTFVLGKLREL